MIGNLRKKKLWQILVESLDVLEVEAWIRTHNTESTGLIKGALFQFVMISLKDSGYLDITCS